MGPGGAFSQDCGVYVAAMGLEFALMSFSPFPPFSPVVLEFPRSACRAIRLSNSAFLACCGGCFARHAPFVVVHAIEQFALGPALSHACGDLPCDRPDSRYSEAIPTTQMIAMRLRCRYLGVVYLSHDIGQDEPPRPHWPIEILALSHANRIFSHT